MSKYKTEKERIREHATAIESTPPREKKTINLSAGRNKPQSSGRHFIQLHSSKEMDCPILFNLDHIVGVIPTTHSYENPDDPRRSIIYTSPTQGLRGEGSRELFVVRETYAEVLEKIKGG